MYNSLWYDSLTKPVLSPPSYIFPPVWSVLYVTIFISLILFIINKTKTSKKYGYIYFSIQMILNLLWSPAFFIMHNIGLALFIVILLDMSVILTIKNFYKVSVISAYLLIPYLIWIIFATYLNISYLILNS